MPPDRELFVKTNELAASSGAVKLVVWPAPKMRSVSALASPEIFDSMML